VGSRCLREHGRAAIAGTGVSLLVNEATLTGNRSVNDKTATNVTQIVLSGERRQTPSGLVMIPALGPTYSDAKIAAVANYVVARFGTMAPPLTTQKNAPTGARPSKWLRPSSSWSC